jgi:hypothetical protein
VGVLGECTTRLVLLARMPDAMAGPALAGFTAKLHHITSPLRQTLSCELERPLLAHYVNWQRIKRRLDRRIVRDRSDCNPSVVIAFESRRWCRCPLPRIDGSYLAGSTATWPKANGQQPLHRDSSST